MMNKHNKQMQICKNDGTCTVIDRGLANCAISGELCDRDRCPRISIATKNTVEMLPASVELLREAWGDIADWIGIRKTHDEDVYEMSVIFYKRFRTPGVDVEMNNLATMSAASEICNTIEGMVLDRAPNITTPRNLLVPGVEFRVCRNVPDGMVYISPRTYYEMVGEILND
jgi:hypothetical protein